MDVWVARRTSRAVYGAKGVKRSRSSQDSSGGERITIQPRQTEFTSPVDGSESHKHTQSTKFDGLEEHVKYVTSRVI